MIIDHEQSRPAFEVGYFPVAIQRDDNKWGWYTDREVQRQWEAWCRALAFANIQAALKHGDLESENAELREKIGKLQLLAGRLEAAMQADGLI